MEQVELKLEKREVLGSTAMRRLRKEGWLPGVVYAGGEAAQAVVARYHDFVLTVRGKPATQLFKVASSTSQLDGSRVIVKHLDSEPLQGRLLHVDFLAVAADRLLVIEVPVHVQGVPEAVKSGQGILEQQLPVVEIECLPDRLPQFLTVDVSGLEAGHAIHAGEIPLPEGVKLRSKADQTIVSVTLPSKEEPAAAAAAPEAAAGAAAPAAAGAAPAAAPAAKKGK